MRERNKLSISVEADTNKLQLKLRAIAKHAEALADELDAIDNTWQCDCGCTRYKDEPVYDGMTVAYWKRNCEECNEAYVIPLKRYDGKA